MRDPNVLRKNTHTHTQSVPYINSQNVSKTKQPSIFVWAHYYEQRKKYKRTHNRLFCGLLENEVHIDSCRLGKGKKLKNKGDKKNRIMLTNLCEQNPIEN